MMTKVDFLKKLTKAVKPEDKIDLLIDLFTIRELLYQFSQAELDKIIGDHGNLINRDQKMIAAKKRALSVLERREQTAAINKRLNILRGSLSNLQIQEYFESLFDKSKQSKAVLLALRSEDINLIKNQYPTYITPPQEKVLDFLLIRLSGHKQNQTTNATNDTSLSSNVLGKKSRKSQNNEPAPTDSVLNASNNRSYRILHQKPIGAGGYGKIKIGVDLNSGKKVAIKIFTYNSNDMGVQRSAEDAVYSLHKLGKLKDEIVVSGRGKDKDLIKHYVVMDYIPGDNLFDILFNENDQKNQISLSRQIRLARSFAKKLHFYHNQGVTVEDIKSENCLADEDDCVELVDLDTVHTDDYPDEISHSTNTEGYAAPELLVTGKSTKKSDIYAAGAVMSDIFTKDNFTTAVGHTEKYHDDKTIKEGTCEKSMQELCKKMLDLNPDKRLEIIQVLDDLNVITQNHYDDMIASLEISINRNASLQFISSKIREIKEALKLTDADYYDELTILTAIIEFSQLPPNRINIARLCKEATQLTVKDAPPDRKVLANSFYALQESFYNSSMANLSKFAQPSSTTQEDTPSREDPRQLIHKSLQSYKSTLASDDNNYHQQLDLLIEIAEKTANIPKDYQSDFWNQYYNQAARLDEIQPHSVAKKELANTIREVRYQAIIEFATPQLNMPTYRKDSAADADEITEDDFVVIASSSPNKPHQDQKQAADNTLYSSRESTDRNTTTILNNIKAVKIILDANSDDYHAELKNLIEISEKTVTEIEDRDFDFCAHYYELAKIQSGKNENTLSNSLHQSSTTQGSSLALRRKTLGANMTRITFSNIIQLLKKHNESASVISKKNINIFDTIIAINADTTNFKWFKPILVESVLAMHNLMLEPNDRNLKIFVAHQERVKSHIKKIRRTDHDKIEIQAPNQLLQNLIDEMQKLNAENIKTIAAYENAMRELEAIKSKNTMAGAIYNEIVRIMQNNPKLIRQQEDGVFRRHIYPSADLILFTKIANATVKIASTPQGETVDYTEFIDLIKEVSSKYELCDGKIYKNLIYLMIGLVLLSALAFLAASTGGFGVIPAIAILAELGPLYCGLIGVGSAIVGGSSAANVYKKNENEKILLSLYNEINNTIPKTTIKPAADDNPGLRRSGMLHYQRQ